jgi:RecB family exonuclease
MESLASYGGYRALRDWARQADPERHAALELAVEVLGDRSGARASSYDGELGRQDEAFEQQFAPGCTWSASGLESYRACPFGFLVGHVLGLEPREEPADRLDGRQLGTLYHHILEAVYAAPGVGDPPEPEGLLAALPAAGAAILDAAPAELGFREAAWWPQTRAEILENVRLSIVALAALPGGFLPYRHEAAFGLRGQPPLVVRQGADSFRLRGFIDRVDRAPDGRVRVIDYKTAGPSTFKPQAVADGTKLQLPLYALAARDGLRLGEPAEGFYWHVQQAEPSPFRMSDFAGGPEGAMEAALDKAWEAVRGARDGHFAPHPPQAGCPAYCAAASFCWPYRPGYGG